MSTKPSLRAIALRAAAAAERGLDRFRYDLIGPRKNARPQILSFGGYRNEHELIIRGRIVEAWEGQMNVSDAALPKVRNMLRLYESDELPGETVKITLHGRTHQVVSDDEGYFSLHLEALHHSLPEHTGIETGTMRIAGHDNMEAHVNILAPGKDAALGVISDIDDTIIETGATNFVRNWRRVLMDTPEERLAVEGAPELYRMLKGGADEGERPIFYVSSSPWNLHGYLERFMDHEDIPKGPMFLKDYGIDDMKFLASPHTDHKIEAVCAILDFYPSMRFLLIGDDGQKDVHVYGEAARRRPGRIAGVFIRDVHGDGRNHLHDPDLKAIEQADIPVYFGANFDKARSLADAIGFGVPC